MVIELAIENLTSSVIKGQLYSYLLYKLIKKQISVVRLRGEEVWVLIKNLKTPGF